MKVKISPVGFTPEARGVNWTWPEDWPVPNVGDELEYRLPDEGDSVTVYVRTIVYYPTGDPEDVDATEPFVYVVVRTMPRLV